MNSSRCTLFHSIFRNIGAIFSGTNLFWIIAALAVTALSVLSGFDWLYFVSLRNTRIYEYLWPAVVIGAFVPIFLPLALLALGYARRSAGKRTHLIVAGWALGQAALLGSLTSSFFKAFTGRIPPPHTILSSALDISHGFRFGLLKGGIFWGWPSSHTTIAFAMACAALALFPKKRWIAAVSLIYAAYIGLGISFSIHWFSEFAAGTIIGAVIGVVVGKSFRRFVVHAD